MVLATYWRSAAGRRVVGLFCLVGLLCSAAARHASAQTPGPGELTVSSDSIYDAALRFSMDNPAGTFAVDRQATAALREALSRNPVATKGMFVWMLATGQTARRGGIQVYIRPNLDGHEFHNFVAGLRDGMLQGRQPTSESGSWKAPGGQYHLTADLRNGLHLVMKCITTTKSPTPAVVCAYLAGSDVDAMRTATESLRAW